MPPSIEQYRRRVANVVIGPSTLRNQGASKVIPKARAFLACVDLGRFVRDSEEEFLAELDRQTEALRASLPRKARHFGTARKAINLFLGEVYYHRVLCQEYGLDKIAPFLEVPLDNLVARFLKKKAKGRGRSLPRWTTIKKLKPGKSRQYQEFATDYAEACGKGWLRVHLDLIIWRSVEEMADTVYARQSRRRTPNAD
jgi:hypothetical protein